MGVTDDLTQIGAPMGRVALRVGEHAIAERVLTIYLQQAPPTPEVIADLARAQAAQAAYDRAQTTLTSGLEADPGQPLLWTSLGELLCLQGRFGQSIVFFEEALRLDPGSAFAGDGLAAALLLGSSDTERALAVSEAAVGAASAEHLPALTAAHARRLLAVGRLAEGWTALASGAEPGDAATVETRIAAPRWTPGAPLDGRLLVMGEENLADELLLAHVAPSLIAEGLPLVLAIAPQWMDLARRSFPEAMLVPRLSRSWRGRLQQAANLDSPHVHGGEPVAAWLPLRSMLSARRAGPEDFAGAQPYLRADSRRVRHWREWLASLGRGPKVGLRWREPLLDVARPCDAPSLPDLQAPLSTPGLELVSLQDGETMGEAAVIQSAFGLKLHEPPGLDREDLDDLAALTRALDVVAGPPGAVTYLAAACGAQTWFLTTHGHWARLGTEGYPWFSRAMVITGDPSDWSGAMTELGEALEDLVEGSARP